MNFTYNISFFPSLLIPFHSAIDLAPLSTVLLPGTGYPAFLIKTNKWSLYSVKVKILRNLVSLGLNELFVRERRE